MVNTNPKPNILKFNTQRALRRLAEQLPERPETECELITLETVEQAITSLYLAIPNEKACRLMLEFLKLKKDSDTSRAISPPSGDVNELH